MNADAVGIYVRKRLEVFNTLQLILHFFLTKLAECNLLKLLATMLRASVVENEENITLLSHVCLPAAAAIVPACVNVMCVRTTVNIHYSRIFLVRIEVYRLHHTPVKVGCAVGSLHSTTGVFRNLISLPRIISLEVRETFAVCNIHNSNIARNIWLRIVVVDIPSALAQRYRVPTLSTFVHTSALACFQVNKENVALNRTNLVRRDDNALTLCIKAKEIKNFPIAFGYLLHIERHGIACHAASRLAD